MYKSTSILAIFLFLGQHAIAAAAGDKPAAASNLRGDIMFASMLCNTPGKSVSARLVKDQASLEAFYEQLQSNTLGARHPVPKMDYSKETILIVEMGQQSTGGYQLSFDSRQPIMVHADHIAATVTWIEPEAGAITTQMLTSPCVLIRLPAGDYPALKIYDQSGKLRYSSMAN